MLAWLDYAWVIEIFNVLVRNKIRTRHLPPSPLPNIVRIAMHIDIYGRSLKTNYRIDVGSPLLLQCYWFMFYIDAK